MASVAATDSPKPAAPAAAKPDAAPVIAALEAMAKSESPALKIYAKRLAEALAGGEVALPKSLADLKPPAAGADAAMAPLAANDRQLVVAADKAVSRYLEAVTAGGPGVALPRYVGDLMIAIVETCPDLGFRMEVANNLILGVSFPQDLVAVDFVAVGRALEMLIAQTLAATAGNPSDEILKAVDALPEDTFPTCTGMCMMGMPQPSQAYVEKASDDLARRLEVAKKATQSEKAGEILDKFIKWNTELRTMAPAIAYLAANYHEYVRLTRALVEALGKNDLKAAAEVCTPAAAAKLEKPSADSIFALPAGAKEVKFMALRLDKMPEPDRATGLVDLRIVGADGKSADVTKEIEFTKSAKGWRVDTP